MDRRFLTVLGVSLLFALIVTTPAAMVMEGRVWSLIFCASSLFEAMTFLCTGSRVALMWLTKSSRPPG